VTVAVAVATVVTVVEAAVMPQQEQALEYLEALSQALAYLGMLLGKMVC
jgi:Asp-tRNA(Asn)/Glu-tRNA(Gln) amidotransferase B subunit